MSNTNVISNTVDHTTENTHIHTASAMHYCRDQVKYFSVSFFRHVPFQVSDFYCYNALKKQGTSFQVFLFLIISYKIDEGNEKQKKTKQP